MHRPHGKTRPPEELEELTLRELAAVNEVCVDGILEVSALRGA